MPHGPVAVNISTLEMSRSHEVPIEAQSSMGEDGVVMAIPLEG